EVVSLKKIASLDNPTETEYAIKANQEAIESRKSSELIHKPNVKDRVNAITDKDSRRHSSFTVRKKKQEEALNLPLFPTTTIGSFPQTDEVRLSRAKLKKGELSQTEYETFVKNEIDKSILWQEELGIDVLVHGEFE